MQCPLRNLIAIKIDLSPGWMYKPAHNLQKSGFSAAVSPYNSELLAYAHFQADISESWNLVVIPVRYLFNFKNRVHLLPHSNIIMVPAEKTKTVNTQSLALKSRWP